MVARKLPFSSIPAVRRSRSTRISPRSLVSRNSARCRAPFPAGSILKFGSGGLNHSHSGIGPSKTPTAMLPLRQLSEGFGVKQIDGIIGTTLFYHFLTTMDYPHGGLVLRRKDAKSLEEFKTQSSGKRVTVPIWMASDHFMVGWGRVENLPPTLLFVDTGLMGAGVKLAESVIKEA